MANSGIPTANILQPGVITTSGGTTRAIISGLQLLTPQYYKKYGQKYGTELYDYFFTWLATFDGMQQVFNQNYFWFESRGKNQIAVTNLNTVSAPAAGATVTVNIPASQLYSSGTYSPLRVGETVYVASSNIGGEILTVPTPDSATIKPKKSTDAFVSANSTDLQAGEILIFGGLTDVGEASTAYTSQTHLDQKYDNNITEIREEFEATDLAEMTDIYYDSGVTGDVINGVGQAGTSYFTYKSMVKTDVRYLNSLESRLFRGDLTNNTGLITTTSVGTTGFIPKVSTDGETVGYTAGTLDVSKLHEITRIMKVNGCTYQNTWLQDIFQGQDFDDGIFKEYPAGAFIWGQGSNSEEASLTYGTQNFRIDNIMFQVKEYKPFNTEFQTGLTPATDYFRNYGVICPNGTVPDARDYTPMKNVSIMYQQPPKGGTTGNAIRTWAWGGGSINATDGTMVDRVSYISYRGLRVVCANQFVIVAA
jgi:hypothetical protein